MKTPEILAQIVETKRQEIEQLYQQYDLEVLKQECVSTNLSFYQKIKDCQGNFFITEFKRKSPSAGWINQEVAIEIQLQQYKDLGTNAVSVLTDQEYFGGSYEDLQKAAKFLQDTDICILNKEFIIDEIQVYLARKFGTNIILLIAAILDLEQFVKLKNLAESLGMGVIAEVHNLEEYRKIQSANCTVLGINNRNLNNFKTAINNCNYIAKNIDHQGFIIAESGMSSALDLKITGINADGFLIGTSLMQQDLNLTKLSNQDYFFKACGIRETEHLKFDTADLFGINFSPISKRRMLRKVLMQSTLPKNAVAVFYQNTEEIILSILSKYPFQYVQLYADDVSFPFIKKTKRRVILSVRIRDKFEPKKFEAYAPYVDFFILDAPNPGQGKEITTTIPYDFPYPFLLAGGINADNLDRVAQYQNCIGVDVASGIETDGEVDLNKLKHIHDSLQKISNKNYANDY